MISAVVRLRLDRFKNACKNPSIGSVRAIKGLKKWQVAKGHCLTDEDHDAIQSALFQAD